MRQTGKSLMKSGGGASRGLWAVVMALLAWGCSESTRSQPQFNAVTGQHPAAWAQNHWAEYVRRPDQCRTCHGSTSDPAAAGGIARVSCFTCHPQGVNHPSGWGGGTQHGRLGAQARPDDQDPKLMAGFAHCAKCHGEDYRGGLSAVSCKGCHTRAPHPDRPWLGASAAVSTHYLTDEGNAPECAKCHAGGANSTRVPASQAPAGTAPGCFNNTLCHARDFGGPI